MAKRTRVSARRSTTRKSARQAHKGAHQAQPQQAAIGNAPPKWRPPGVAIEYTPELLENARQRFEETDELAPSIAADMGIHPRTLSRLAIRQGWKRRRQPRDLSSAARLLMEAERLEAAKSLQSAKQTVPAQCDTADTDGGAALVPSGEPTSSFVGEDVARIRRAALKELSSVETMRAARKGEPQSPIDAERTARTLASLTATLQKIYRMECAAPQTQAGSNDDDWPVDTDEFRNELARRINAFVASRTGGGDAEPSGA